VAQSTVEEEHVILGLAIGCGWFDKVKEDVDGVVDDIEGATTPILGQGFLLGIESPQQPELQPLVESGVLEPGTGMTLFLADAASADQIEESLVSGAIVAVDTPAGRVSAVESEQGVYTIDPVTGELAYEDGERWTILLDVGDAEIRGMHIDLPPAAEVDLPTFHDAGAPIELDLTGQGFHSTLLVVTDVTTGNTTYTSEPESAEELYELTAQSVEVGVVTVPGSAFPGAGTYALGIAGMQHDTDEDLVGLNTILSRGMAGKMRIFPVIVQ
jgi:hypothetical protein